MPGALDERTPDLGAEPEGHPLDEEYRKIVSKIVTFELYQGSPEFQELPKDERMLCYDQLHYMKAYRTILRIRRGELKPI